MISIADLQDKSCSQSHIPLFIIAHSGFESRHKLKCSAELLHGIPGSTRGGRDSETGCHNRRRYA
jgi:hypothetical protein